VRAAFPSDASGELSGDLGDGAAADTGMEPLWSPVFATGGNQRQIDPPQNREKQAKTVAVCCDRLPEAFHGKEGVDGSSPSEGFEEMPANRDFVSSDRATRGYVGDAF
jgi:hypothetical protein